MEVILCLPCHPTKEVLRSKPQSPRELKRPASAGFLLLWDESARLLDMRYKKQYRRSRRIMRQRGIDPLASLIEFRKKAFFGKYEHYSMSGRKYNRRKGHWGRAQQKRSQAKQELRKERP